MPTYEYRCRSCGDTFALRRSMADSDAPAPCPSGHDDATRLLSVFAAVGSATCSGPSPSAGPPAGPCGGGCACYPG